MSLKINDFETFYEAVYDRKPFAWQIKLAERVCKTGWPNALDLPTASGKTTVIDIAVFHLALEAEKKNRNAAMRIALIVDRRLVVDDAFKHATKLSKALHSKSEKSIILRRVADVLEKISIDGLKVVRLRGGMPQENEWARTPSTPTIIISTIDQIGSRLLFRGYGVSNSMKPVHAGLLGSDTLYLIDEAHISQPFVDTLGQISKIQNTNGWKSSLRTVFMSATLPPDKNQDVFPSKDKMNEELLLDMGKRITAHKYAKLKSESNDVEAQIIKSSCKFIKKKKDNESKDIKTVGIIVNRVYSARKIFSEIKKEIDKDDYKSLNEIHLLTGRIRPLDRDRLIKNKIEQIRPDANNQNNKVMFFVCTQCVEVGVDITFDALITQIAPLDSLRQRFGRLNRIGLRDISHAQIIAAKDDVKTNADDFIYKNSSAETWKYLKTMSDKSGIDFGIQYFKEPSSENIKKMLSPKSESVTILPSYIHFWSQTNPQPSPDPDPALFLHGIKSKSADVQIIWRADVTKEMLEKNKPKQANYTQLIIPTVLEAISVPIWTVKKWIEDKEDTKLTDIEGSGQSDEKIESERNVLRWRGADKDAQSIKFDDIKPGDIIIVPTEYGGCDEYGWDGNTKTIVKDISIEANLIHRRRLAIKFNEKIITDIASNKAWKEIKKITIEYAESTNIKAFFDEIKNVEGFPEIWKDIMNMLVEKYAKRDFYIQKTEEGNTSRIIGFSYKKKISEKWCNDILTKLFKFEKTSDINYEDVESEASTEMDHVGSATKDIFLDEHCKGVENFVEKFCSKINLESNVVKDIMLSARLHDIGKTESRCQAFLRRKDPDVLNNDKPIAKSKVSFSNGMEYEKYRKIARLPKKFRHECWSVALAKNHTEVKKAHDYELVLYLIGSHHGHGRPLFPSVDDEHKNKSILTGNLDLKIDTCDIPNGLDSNWIDMFEKLYRKYGPWELAHMESILRLADHRQSEKEETDVN